MFCPKCGKEINDEAVICIGCGCSVNSAKSANNTESSETTKPTPESNGMANCALLCAFLIPILGLILGIVGVCKYKTQSNKGKCLAAIGVSIIVWIISFAILAAIGL